MKSFNTAHSSAPFFRSNQDSYKIMTSVYKALLVLWASSIFIFGYAAILVVLTGLITGSVLVFILQFFNQRFYFNSDTWKISVMLFTLSLPPATPWYVVVIGVFVMLIINQFLFTVNGQNIFNPALVGRVTVTTLFPLELYNHWPLPVYKLFPYVYGSNVDQGNDSIVHSLLESMHMIAGFKTYRYDASKYQYPWSSASASDTISEATSAATSAVETFSQSATVDAVSTPSYIYVLKNFGNSVVELPEFSWMDLFLGLRQGALGETSILVLLILGIWLSIKKIIDFRIPLIYLLTFTALNYIFGGLFLKQGLFYAPVIPYTFLGSAFFISIFFITDYGSIPVNRSARYLMAVLIATLAFWFRYVGHHNDGQTHAVLLMLAFNAFFEIICRSKPFGKKSYKTPLPPSTYSIRENIFIKFGIGSFIILVAYIGSQVVSTREFNARNERYYPRLISDIFPQYVLLEKLDDQVYCLSDPDRNPAYAVFHSGSTHHSKATLGIIFQNDTIRAIEILYPFKDTAGLGDKIYLFDWEQNLVGMPVKYLYTSIYQLNIDTITGATVTSAKILEIAQKAHNKLQTALHKSSKTNIIEEIKDEGTE